MRVLAVEDEVSLAETVRDGLTAAGFIVDLAHNGIDGLWTAAEAPYGAYDAENVWDANFSGDPNIVEVYIGYLRTKIDHPYGRCAIQTVRGSGYRLAADGR